MMRTYFAGLFFSIGKKALSKEGLRAIWAETVSNTLADPRIKTIEKPLIEQIKSISLPSAISLYDVNQEQIQAAKDQLMLIFKVGEGIKLPKQLTAIQERVELALNRNLKLTFYPNLSVTPLIFQTIHRNYQRALMEMTFGKPGISKTVNLLLGWTLSSIVIDYRCAKPEEAKDLLSDNLLNPYTKKILYINYNIRNPTIQLVIQSLKAQCSPEVRRQVQALLDIQSKRITMYPGYDYLLDLISLITMVYNRKQIDCLMIHDQINSLAGIFKDYNMKKLNSSGTRREIQQLDTKLKAVIVINQIYRAALGFQYKIFSSSANIEPELLEAQTAENSYTLNLNHHQKLTFVHCRFDAHLLKSTHIKQLYRFLWYEISKLLEKTTANNLQTSAIKICDKLAQEKGFYSFVNPLSIRTVVSTRVLSLGANTRQNELQEAIKDVFKEVYSKGMEILKQKMSKYVSDTDPIKASQKMGVYFAFWMKLKSLPKQEINDETNKQSYVYSVKNQKLSLSSVMFITEIQKFTLERGKQLDSAQIMKSQDKDIFELVKVKIPGEATNEEAKLKPALGLLVSKRQFLQLVQDWFRNTKQGNSYLMEVIVFSEDNALSGKIIENQTLYLLKNIQDLQFNDGTQTFKVDSSCQFIHFLQNDNFEESLKNVFQKAKRKSGTYFCGLPITKELAKSPNSPSFDLLLVKHCQDSQKFQIVSYDFTVLKSSLKNKVDQVEVIFSKMQKNSSQIKSWQHRIICLPKHIQQKQTEPKGKFCIAYTDILKISFTSKGGPNELLIQATETLKKLQEEIKKN